MFERSGVERRDGQRQRGRAAAGHARHDVASTTKASPTPSTSSSCRGPSRPATDALKATGQLHRLGQSLWLDNITRDLLTSGTLQHYIDDLSVTGLTSNPTIFEQAIKNSAAYDAAIAARLAKGKSGEALFFDLAIEDLTRAADLFRPIHDRTNGMDGWVSLEVSPLLAYDTAGTHRRGQRPLRQGRAART